MTTFQKLWYLLNHEQRSAAKLLMVLMLIGMVLETLGIGLVIPALAVMTQENIGLRYPLLVPFLTLIGAPSHEQLVIWGMLALVAMYAAKSAFLVFLAWRQARFAFRLQASISYELFSGYLRQPYTFHLQRNSAQLIRNTIGQTSDIINVIQQGLLLLAEALVILGVFLLLLLIEPLGALVVVGTVGGLGWVFQRLARKHLLRWGEQRQFHEGLRIQHLQQGLGGAKDVKLLGREDDFLAQYEVHNTGSARVAQRQAVLSITPRLWLELLAVIGLAALVLIMIKQGKPLDGVLPTLGVFAAAAFRLMPSANRVIGAIQSLRYNLPVIDTLYSELSQIKAETFLGEVRPITFNTELTLEMVGLRYPSSEAFALRDISLSIRRGTSVGFIGGSGAGKTTLVDIILGLLPPTSGMVKVDGFDIQTNLRGWQDQIGYVPQTIYLTDDSIRRNIAFGLPSDQIDDSAVWRAISAARLESFVGQLPQGLETFVGERGIRLSGGQRQRIGIARALYHEPSVLVLDEATSSLDTNTESEVMDAVRALQGNKTVLIVAHRLSTVEHCDRLFCLDQGRVVEEGETAVVLGKLVTQPAYEGVGS